LVESWIAHEQYSQAESALRERVRRAPHDGDARLLLARALAGSGQLLACAKELHAVPYWWPKKPDALLREGQAYLMLNRAKDAEAAWLAVVEDDPLHPRPPDVFHDASLELLKLYSTEDRWEDANVVLWGAYEKASPLDRVTLLSMRLRSELERVAPAEAIVLIERYVAADPTDWEALLALARDEFALGRPEDAMRHFEECLKGQPESPRVWRDYLTSLHDQGDMATLSAAVARIPQAAESEPEIWKFRGLLKEKAGDWEGAAQDYREALARNPYIQSYHYRLSMVEERLGHRDVAAEHRKQVDRLRVARGQLLQAFSDVRDARERNTSNAPDLSVSMRHLASVCETLGWARLASAWNELADSP
jgi:tetratricopeptide (TPR) repeat protein